MEHKEVKFVLTDTKILESQQSDTVNAEFAIFSKPFLLRKKLQISEPYCDFSPIMKTDNREWERFWFGSRFSVLTAQISRV